MDDKIIFSDSRNFEQDVLKSDLPVAVYFYSEDCPPCIALEPVFERMAQMYGKYIKFIKIFRQQNRQLAEKYNIKNSPSLLFFRNGEEICARLSGYISPQELRQAVERIVGGDCPAAERHKAYFDVIILGAGPAGLTAAIYASRSRLATAVIDEGPAGGQASTTFHVANYPGTNGVIRGTDLMGNMKKQALDFGAQIDDMKKVSIIGLDGREKHIQTEDADYYGKTVIIATGSQPRKLPAEGERDFRGRGVHYCAACDGAMYQDADILVVGGGNSAVEEAVFLTRYAKHVTVVHQLDHFQASQSAQDEALKHPDISVIWDSEIRKIEGDNFVRSVTIQNLKTKETKKVKTDGLFVYIGMEPGTGLFKDKIKLNESGYIPTDEDMLTNVGGVFAAGDVRDKKIRQISTAVGDGTIAGITAEKYIKNQIVHLVQ